MKNPLPWLKRETNGCPDPAEAETRVECYAGHTGDETPRAVIVAGKRSEVVEVLRRARILDRADGSVRDVWRCRLEDGREVNVERLQDGSWRVSAAA